MRFYIELNCDNVMCECSSGVQLFVHIQRDTPEFQNSTTGNLSLIQLLKLLLMKNFDR